MALRPACHEVKHAGLASKRARLDAVVKQLVKVNRWSADDAELYLEAAFETWAQRSRTNGHSTPPCSRFVMALPKVSDVMTRDGSGPGSLDFGPNVKPLQDGFRRRDACSVALA